MKKRQDRLASLAAHLKDRDVRGIVRGALDGKAFWVLFGPGDDGRCYRVENYVCKRGKWTPAGDGIESGDDEHAGWDMLGMLFARAFTEP